LKDKNGGSELNEAEIIACDDLIDSPIALEEVKTSIAMRDGNGNGSISLPEFLKALHLEEMGRWGSRDISRRVGAESLNIVICVPEQRQTKVRCAQQI
jgi:hypothetical protein